MSDTRKQQEGKVGHLSGLAAEDAVVRQYVAAGADLAQQRWRGQGGEIDLIFHDDGVVVFVEVKKSRTFARAAARLQPRQMARLMAAAEEFLGREPNGLLTDMRFDVALVDGTGDVHIIENALQLE